jgi:phage FluMu protein Com
MCKGKTLTKEEFIEKAIKKHGNKYNYDLFVYVKNSLKGKIICNTCNNIFDQQANSHLCGSGCPYCKKVKKITIEEFIERSNLIHKNKYDYSLCEYKNWGSKVKIICPIHGVFEQEAGHHLKGTGCPHCFGRYKTTEDFIKQAMLIHGNKYDYSKVNYINATTPIIIICPIHGEFKQIPNNHLQKNGCSLCTVRGLYTEGFFLNHPEQKNNKGFLYYISINNGEYYKIGITEQITIKNRMYGIKEIAKKYKKNIYKIETIIFKQCTIYEAFITEQQILNENKEFNIIRRWSGELFKIDILNNIKHCF